MSRITAVAVALNPSKRRESPPKKNDDTAIFFPLFFFSPLFLCTCSFYHTPVRTSAAVEQGSTCTCMMYGRKRAVWTAGYPAAVSYIAAKQGHVCGSNLFSYIRDSAQRKYRGEARHATMKAAASSCIERSRSALVRYDALHQT